MTKTISINNEELYATLERLQYEIDGRKEIMGYLISNNNMSTDAFRQYEAEYQQRFIEYQKVKQQFEDEIVRPAMADVNALTYSWHLDFITKTVTVTY